MKQIISVIQQKGGVGKTTLTVHLAHELRVQNPNWRIAIADADPQQSATKWVARGKLMNDSGIDAYTVAADGEGKHLRKELEAIDANVVLIDLPPAIESVSLRAALYAHLMLVPVGASALDIEAAKAAIDVCEEAQGLDGTKKFLIVPSKVRSSTAAGRELRTVLSRWGQVSETTLGLRVAYSDAATTGEGINSYAPSSAAHQEMKKLAREVTVILGGCNGQQKALAS